MLNRLADKVLEVVLPHQRASAPCGSYYEKFCYCSGGRKYRQKCQDCTSGGGCTSCYVTNLPC